ncbi:MAG: glycosyltransferase family 39 protein [Candidatus Moranbacteria bacterium]|nr:glycosyltransferase family 39 protein [Candidatus Moranbacteria bacterium]
MKKRTNISAKAGKNISPQKKNALKDRVVRVWKDKSFMRHKFFFLTLAAVIFAIAILARTYHITTLPPGVYPDEAVNGTDALNANETGHYQLFYPNNYGREGLFMNLIALGFKIFGVSVITLKMWSVLFGVLTVAGVMLLARELFGTYRTGLVAGFLYATSFWAINFNRISFRANMLPFVLVFTFYFLFKGLREKRFRDYVYAGLFFGLGIHGYIAFRIAPIILVMLLLAFLISKKKFLREYWKPILAFFLAAFFVALPMLLDFYFHPEYFATRSESVSVFSPKVNQGHLAKALWESATKTFGMFNFQGDQNWRHNFPGQPELQSWTGIFFLIGIIILIYYFFYWIYQGIKSGQRSQNFVISVLLLSWLVAMLLPGLLTYEGLPHALRTIGALPAAILIAAFAVEMIFRFLDHLKTRNFRLPFAQLGRAALIILIVWSGFVGVKTYFIDWASAPQIHAAFSQNFKNMALYLNNLPPGVNKYVVANAGGQIMDDGLPVSAEVVKLLTYYPTPGIIYSRPADFDPQSLKAPAKVVLMYYDGEVIAKIKSVFPNALVQKLDPQPGNGTDYYVINVN